MSTSRNRLLARLIRTRPAMYLRLKGLARYRLGADAAFREAHARLVAAGDCGQNLPERHHLWSLTRAAAETGGAMAEVGVHRGASAELIATAKGAAALHLFDTFAGMPATDPATDGRFTAGQFADASLAGVQARLAGFAHVHFHPGFFPDSAQGLDPALRFALVHLDVDLHRSTLDGLRYFYPRLLPGGFLISHDYGDLSVPGVKQAFDEFLRDKPERVVPLWPSQGLLVRLSA
jgi:O-methyltransferase